MARDMASGSYWNIDSNLFDCNDGEITPNCVAVLEKALDKCYNVRYMPIC